MRLFTIGYEKRGIENFIEILKENNIDMLVDIRAVPHSRNKDYAKKNLEFILNKNDIDYLLTRKLGSPEDIRKKVKIDGDYDYFFREYDKFLEGKKEYLTNLVKIAKRRDICLLCFEADFNYCHRRPVAERMAEMGGGFKIIHL
ncbi:MAG: DUF488 domain-containing protein [Candidatus Zixiibacteriota bacterium]|nr:MAG: DUF488 domain-containing protein [candidate division Zixibacteria bacterium]